MNGKRNLQLLGNDASMYRALKHVGADFSFDEVCLLRIVFDAPELSNLDPSVNFDLALLLEKLDSLFSKYVNFYLAKYNRSIPERSMAILSRDFQQKRQRFVGGFKKLFPEC